MVLKFNLIKFLKITKRKKMTNQEKGVVVFFEKDKFWF